MGYTKVDTKIQKFYNNLPYGVTNSVVIGLKVIDPNEKSDFDLAGMHPEEEHEFALKADGTFVDTYGGDDDLQPPMSVKDGKVLFWQNGGGLRGSYYYARPVNWKLSDGKELIDYKFVIPTGVDEISLMEARLSYTPESPGVSLTRPTVVGIVNAAVEDGDIVIPSGSENFGELEDVASTATPALNNFVVGDGSKYGTKTLDETKTILGIGGNNGGDIPDTYGLRFDHDKGHNVFGGEFWAADTDYWDMTWLGYCIPTGNHPEYFGNSGSAGRHIGGLFGFAGNSNGWTKMVGNIAQGAALSGDNVQYDSNDYVMIGDPVHIAITVHYTSKVPPIAATLVLWIKGVPSKRFYLTTSRRAQRDYDRTIYAGAPGDHSGFDGYGFFLQFFENVSLFENIGYGYAPSREPRRDLIADINGVSTLVKASLYWDFRDPNQGAIIDHSKGFGNRQHDGIRTKGVGVESTGAPVSAGQSSVFADLPQFRKVSHAPKPTILVASAVPSGALFHDSFKRQDVTRQDFLFLGLGNSEGGSIGVKAWQDSQYYGILSGRVFRGFAEPSIPKVEIGSSYIKTVFQNDGAETDGLFLYSSFDFTTMTGIYCQHYNDSFIFNKMTNGAPEQLGSYEVGRTTPYEVAVAQTENKHLQLIINGTVRVDYDNSANPVLDGTFIGFRLENGFNRCDEITVFAAN